jgi:hypothetical protein
VICCASAASESLALDTQMARIGLWRSGVRVVLQDPARVHQIVRMGPPDRMVAALEVLYVRHEHLTNNSKWCIMTAILHQTSCVRKQRKENVVDLYGVRAEAAAAALRARRLGALHVRLQHIHTE